jgi:L-glyceraldehyde 3-phosphate reductase
VGAPPLTDDELAEIDSFAKDTGGVNIWARSSDA